MEIKYSEVPDGNGFCNFFYLCRQRGGGVVPSGLQLEAKRLTFRAFATQILNLRVFFLKLKAAPGPQEKVLVLSVMDQTGEELAKKEVEVDLPVGVQEWDPHTRTQGNRQTQTRGLNLSPK